MKLYQGRPKTAEGREKKEMKVYDLLDSLDIDYVRADHEAVMTIEACKEVDEALEIEICKNLFLCNRQKTAFYLLVLPGGKSLQTKELSKQIPTSRLSFASGDDMERLLNVTPGSATIMGLSLIRRTVCSCWWTRNPGKSLVCLSPLCKYIQHQTEDRGCVREISGSGPP